MILRQFKETLMDDCSFIYIYIDVQISLRNFNQKMYVISVF
jgi:hypothetical protein